MKINNLKSLACDLDDTLVYLEGGHDEYFKFLESYGLPRAIICDGYEATKCEEGFSMKNLLVRIEKMTGKKIEKEQIIRDFDSWLPGRLKVYPDVGGFLSRIKMAGLAFSIVSTGEPDFQKEKARLAGLGQFELRAVPPGGKPAVIRQLLDRGLAPMLVIDDKGNELDAIRKVFDERDIQTVRIKRADSPYKDEPAEFMHEEILSLAEIEI